MIEKFDYKKVDANLLKKDTGEAPAENPFLNKRVVFTGDMISWERNTAAFLLQKLGADVNTSISKKTNIVIIGNGCGPAKLEKIIELLADGIEIKLMNERIFCESIKPFQSIIQVS